MWSGKMATRWRRKDGHLKPVKGPFVAGNNPNELNLNTEVDMTTHSTVDHSILAIFEDSSDLSEDEAGAEEDSDQLLSAFTEMLESVEDDDDTLSPFNILPQTTLLMSQDTTKESSFHDTHYDQDLPWNDEMEQTGTLFQLSNHKMDAEVEVFTSSSLVNLVKIMHPYCLKLQVEEESWKYSKNSVLFSKEEVWKYERPTEDIDEEINVVSDDEEPMQVEMKAQDNSSKALKSVLLNGSLSKKEKKRVSFGTVQVASFSMDTQAIDVASPAAIPTPSVLANVTVLQGVISSENDQTSDAWSRKTEGKRKPISLQQYRQLREKRQPLVEKQGNYTTKWPSVSVPPKELTPILGIHGQKKFKPVSTQNSISSFTGTKTLPNVQSIKTKVSCDLPHKEKCPRPNAKIQSVAPLVDQPVHLDRKSPTKKSLLVSSDPPNPVLVPMALPHPSPNEQFTEEGSIKKSNTAPKCNNQSPIPAVEQTCLPNTLHFSKQSTVAPTNSPLSYEPPTPVTTPVKEIISEVAFRVSPPSLRPLSSGIEASDLTSLLEQFEETQAKEEGEKERPQQTNNKLFSKLYCAAPNSILQTVSSHDPARPMPHLEERLSTSRLDSLNCQPDLKIPEVLGTEVILSSTEDLPVRRKVPFAKSIQIIDPRPLPFKRTHTSHLELTHTQAHINFAISSDHDYCAVANSYKTQKSTTFETTEIHVPCPKQMNEVNGNTSNKNATQDECTELPTVNPNLLTDSAEKQNCSDLCLDTYMIPPTPPPSPPCKDGDRKSPPHRGRDRDRDMRKYRRRSRSSDSSSNSSSCSLSASSSSRSGSRSPKRQRRRHSSESSSCSSSPSRSTSRSPPRQLQERYSRLHRSRCSSWSQCRSRSRSLTPPQRVNRRRWTDVRSKESRKLRREQEIRVQKLRAIDERRVVYVGRIRKTMTHEELRERFSQFGEVESVSLHFRDRGDHYGFVTFYNMDDAFAAIDNGGKLRKPDELPFDICFGGRRQFCNSDYADLDANRDADPAPLRSRFEEVDFDLLLKQAQNGLKR